MQKMVRELLFQRLDQPYFLLFCFELKSLCILFHLNLYLAKSPNSCSDTQPDSCVSNSTLLAAKKPQGYTWILVYSGIAVDPNPFFPCALALV